MPNCAQPARPHGQNHGSVILGLTIALCRFGCSYGGMLCAELGKKTLKRPAPVRGGDNCLDRPKAEPGAAHGAQDLLLLFGLHIAKEDNSPLIGLLFAGLGLRARQKGGYRLPKGGLRQRAGFNPALCQQRPECGALFCFSFQMIQYGCCRL